MGKILNREPPDWQQQKLILAQQIVLELKDVNANLKLLQKMLNRKNS